MYFQYFRTFLVLLAGLVITSSPAYSKNVSSSAKPAIMVEDAWSIPTFAGSKVGVGYLTITNNGSDPDVLLRAASPAAGMVELHENVTDGDMIRMKKLERVIIPAGETITLAPGKMHLMLMMLKKPLTLGDRFNVTLTFEKAGDVTTSVNVVDKQRLIK